MTACRLDLQDADVVMIAGFLLQEQADHLFEQLSRGIAWRQDVIMLYGRESLVPRLGAWYGDPGAVYTYSHITMQPEPWSPPLLEIKARVEHEASNRFNSVLCNLYRDGRDSVSWHSDDEPDLGPCPVVASVSLGDTRTFQLRHKIQRHLRHQIELPHGSLLLMQGPTQHHWRHQVPKTARPVGPRINLTFRTVQPLRPDIRSGDADQTARS